MSTQDKDSSHFQKIQVHCVLILGKHKCNIGETWKTCGYYESIPKVPRIMHLHDHHMTMHMCPFCTGLQEERPGRVRIPYLRPHGSYHSHVYPPFFGRCSCGTPKKISCLGRSPLSRLGSGGYVAQNQRKENFVAPWHSRILWKRTGMRGMVLETYWYWHHSTWLEAWSRSSPIWNFYGIRCWILQLQVLLTMLVRRTFCRCGVSELLFLLVIHLPSDQVRASKNLLKFYIIWCHLKLWFTLGMYCITSFKYYSFDKSLQEGCRVPPHGYETEVRNTFIARGPQWWKGGQSESFNDR